MRINKTLWAPGTALTVSKTLCALSAEVPDGSLIITVQPKSYFGPIGSDAAFTVAANDEDVTYQWQYRKPGNEWKNSGAAGATTAAMTVDVIETRDGQQYRCVVTRGSETVISFPATITISEAAAPAMVGSGPLIARLTGRLNAAVDGGEDE